MTEFSDAEVMQPAHEMNDADVMQPQAPQPKPFVPLIDLPDDVRGLTVSQAIEFVPVQMYRGLRDMFLAPGKAAQGQLTPEQETEFAGNAALTMLGGSEIPRPGLGKAIGPAVKEFQDTVIAPGLQKIAAEARPPANTPEGVMAQPEVRDAIVNGPVNRDNHVPYEAGAAKGADNTTNIDKSIPEVAKLPSGAQFDTATPLKIHEQVEKFVMDKLTAGGMSDEAAYRVGHWEYAERAEDAWYASQGIDPREAEAWWQERAGHIEHEPTSDTPADLYAKPYPHDSVSLAHEDTVATQKPSPEEIAQAQQILGKTSEEMGGHLADFFKARELGLLAPDEINLVELAKQENETPAEAAMRAVPPQNLGAAVTPEGMRGPLLGHEPGAYNARGKEWIDKIDAPEDVREAIEKMAAEHDFFRAARGGKVPPEHVAAVAEAAGLDPKDLDRNYLSEHFDNDGKVRALIQTLRQTTQDFMEAKDRTIREPSDENAAAQLIAQTRHQHVLEYVMGSRAEAGRTLNAWKDLLRQTERSRAVVDIKGKEESGALPKGVADLVDAVGEVRNNLSKSEPDKLGLDKLIESAERLAEAPPPAPKEGQPAAPLPPDIARLVDEAKGVLRDLKGRAEKPRKGDPELEAFRAELVALDKGEGNLGKATEAARRFVEATKKEAKEVTEPGEPKERGKLAGAARRFVQAADHEPQLAKAPASAEMQSLMETARQAIGRLKGSHLQSEFEAFRSALDRKDYDGAVAAAKQLTEAEPKPAAGAPKPPVEFDKAMGAARRVAQAAEEQAKGVKAKLPPDLENFLNDAKQAAGELTAQRKNGLSQLVKAAEQQAVNMVKQKAVRKPAEAIPPEWQALVEKAERVTKRFGGIAKGEEAALLLARSGRTAAEQAELARSVEGLTPNQVARVLKRLNNESRPGWYFWTVQQALISGLITHTKYAVVNLGQTFLDRVVAPEGAAILDRLRGGDASLVAPLHAIPAMIRSVPDAFAGVKQAFKTGMRVPLESELRLAERGEPNPEAAGAQVPYGRPQGPNWGIWKRVFNEDQLAKAERVIGVPGRSANSLHTFFKILNERGAAATRAYEAAQAEKPGANFWDRYQYHLDNPSDAALRQNVEDAYSGTFMEKLGEQSEKFAKLVRNSPAKWLIFFTHIPLNMIRRGVEYSPLAALNMLGETKMGNAIKGKLGPEAQNLAFSKMAVGTAVGAYFINKALSGDATGDYPRDPKERLRWQALGIQPNSIKADGQWISLERLGPPAMVARIAANFASVIQHYDGHDDDALMKASLATVLGTANVLASDVGFETVKNIVDVLENPREAARFAAWQLSSYAMPVSFITQGASAMDPYMRHANTLLDGLKYHLPLARETLLPKRDPVFGEPVPNPGYHGILRASPVNTSPIKAELDRIGYFPAEPQKHIGSVKLDAKQYEEYEATAGPIVKRLLGDTMNSPAWKALPVAQQQATAKGLIATGRALARQAMMAHHPEIVQQAKATREQAILGH